ncbi:3-phosphoshikimate 1-carboxyvinyltransferase [Bacillus sp. CGMCC 1.16541]|uniref:3-phosphoshikimate 1-carboxyvinyltransferase n=1 Tax=Bacillus sp. CGMCC 1.16541 TaxID=2185143 RepID=UPI000D730D17|nr:3-phosphoshikimate 1-carboxyvinyltransferase [Bacillus sp. CGMCC 1.16541]
MSQKQLYKNGGNLNGELRVPGDKSISHRAVMFGAIAEGKTKIYHFLPGEDCLSTISCFQQMGVSIKREHDYVEIDGKGVNGLSEPSGVLDVGNSGTTTRLMLGILAGAPFHTTLIGDESIAKRPMGRVTVPLRSMGAKIDGRELGQFTPLSTRGGTLRPIRYESPVASAQVKSSILLAGLHAKGTTVVTEPHKSRDHTERMLTAFGVDVDVKGTTISIEGGQTLKGTDIHVPGDISSAAFFLVAGAIVSNSHITLRNVGLNPTRTGIIDVLQQMGASIEVKDERIVNGEPVGDLVIETSDLHGIEIGGDIIPRLIDEIPIIALLATQASGKTVIKDAEELKVKETNRIDTVVSELKKLGANIVTTNDGMIIEGRVQLSGGTVDSHGDHRIGMMLAIASCITNGDTFLERAEAIHVSYPNFFTDLEYLLNESSL